MEETSEAEREERVNTHGWDEILEEESWRKGLALTTTGRFQEKKLTLVAVMECDRRTENKGKANTGGSGGIEVE